MKKDISVYLKDILDSMNLIDTYVQDFTFISFEQNMAIQDAVLRRFEIIGEAVSHLPNEFKETNALIPWRKMTGLRNILIHDYGSVELKEVWIIATKDLPSTRKEIQKIIRTGKN